MALEDEKRVVASPRDRDAAERHAEALGLPVQISSLVPPGTIYVLDPARVFSTEEDGWPLSSGRLEGLGS